MRDLLIVGACAALWCSPAWAQRESPVPARSSWESFDRVLELILRASQQEFRGLEGVRIENRRREFYFEAKRYLPEASYCRILEGPAYCCEWDVGGQAAASALFERISARTAGALGAEWAKTAKSGKARQDTLFRAEGKATVQLIRHSSPPKVYVLVLPPGSAKEGYTGNIPSIEDFLHP